MQFKRVDRINSLIKEELSEIIQRKIKDPRVGFVTIAEVDVSKDLRSAKVYVSIMGSDGEINDSIAGLQNAEKFIRMELYKRLRLKYIPEIIFKPDRSLEHGSRILKILEEISKGEKKED